MDKINDFSRKPLAGSAKHVDIKPQFERRASVDIAKSFVELNVKAVIDSEKEANVPEPERKRLEKLDRKNKRTQRRKQHRLRNLIALLVAIILLALGSAAIWWNSSIGAVNLADKNDYQFTVTSGASIDAISNSLRSAGFIRNTLAFRIYARLSGAIIKAGTFNLSPSDNLPEIAKKLGSNDTASISVVIPPGVTLKQLSDDTFTKAGFGQNQISSALSAVYNNSILAGKPSGTSLEGYLFPDTYKIGVNDSLNTLIDQSLTQLNSIAKKDDLKAKFAKHGLSFYEGLTLASIVTEEVSNSTDQKKVAGVFLNRLASDMPLQSDTTFHYAYKQGLCSTDDTTCDSAYNTYQNPGLPPGPISNPSESALEAVANPTSSSYLYFVADANGTTHYENTLAEQQADIAQYGLSGN